MPALQGSDRQLRRHGDALVRLPNGYYMAQGRTDDTMNLGGIKVGCFPQLHCSCSPRGPEAAVQQQDARSGTKVARLVAGWRMREEERGREVGGPWLAIPH